VRSVNTHQCAGGILTGHGGGLKMGLWNGRALPVAVFFYTHRRPRKALRHRIPQVVPDAEAAGGGSGGGSGPRESVNY